MMITIKREFTFITSDGTIRRIFPFRVGDIVTVSNWGESYSTYPVANKYFTNSSETPYYSVSTNERSCSTEFKIIGIAEHSGNRDIVTYIRDRSGKDVIIGIHGLNLVKQYPLRKNEKQIIQLEKIK